MIQRDKKRLDEAKKIYKIARSNPHPLNDQAARAARKWVLGLHAKYSKKPKPEFEYDHPAAISLTKVPNAIYFCSFWNGNQRIEYFQDKSFDNLLSFYLAYVKSYKKFKLNVATDGIKVLLSNDVIHKVGK